MQAQYAATFKARFERWLRSGRSSKPNRTNDVLYEQSIVDSPPIPLAVWVMNAIRGLPTSEDLRRTYFWESKRRGAQETESLAAEKRKSRMQRLWRVQWSGTVRMLVVVDDGLFEWRTVFAMIQGHRLLWWRSVGDFDSGVPPIGRLFLAGHVGLSSPSPLELREIRPEDVELVVSIFGSGSRVTILTQSIETKTDLEEAVESAVTNKTD